MKRYNITVPKKYTKDGVEKTQWNNVGRLIEFKEGEFALELNMFPDTKFGVFEDKPKIETKAPAPEYPEENIDASGIPF